ncbi:MAG TPA: alpha/beta hydrolase [Streptosporangiaceae bacterium]
MTGANERPPRRTITVAENRAGHALAVRYQGDPVPLPVVRDGVVPGPGGDVPVRMYRPDADGPLPVLVYLHGGGWVLGSLETCDRTCRNLAALTGCAVVSVDYRLAPEHPFPAALDDARAVVHHLAANPEAYGVDAGRIAVGGDSAGGNLSAVLAQESRRTGPPLRHQLLIYPVCDTETGGDGSYRAYAAGFSMTRDDMLYYLDAYLAGQDPADVRVAPAREPDLAGLPSATVITAECDVLRDEGERYAHAMSEAGVRVTHRRYAGMFHPFFPLLGTFEQSREAQRFAAEELRTAFT